MVSWCRSSSEEDEEGDDGVIISDSFVSWRSCHATLVNLHIYPCGVHHLRLTHVGHDLSCASSSVLPECAVIMTKSGLHCTYGVNRDTHKLRLEIGKAPEMRSQYSVSIFSNLRNVSTHFEDICNVQLQTGLQGTARVHTLLIESPHHIIRRDHK